MKRRSFLPYVQACLDTLLEKGTDRYGPVHTPQLVSILDMETLECPKDPKPLDEYFRITRRGRRSPAGSNLQTDQPTLKAMVQLSKITGDEVYKKFADQYAGYVMENLLMIRIFLVGLSSTLRCF